MYGMNPCNKPSIYRYFFKRPFFQTVFVIPFMIMTFNSYVSPVNGAVLVTEEKLNEVKINITKEQSVIAVVCKETNQLFLIDNNGELAYNSPLKGMSDISVSRLVNKKQLNILVSSRNMLINYPIA